MEQSDAAGCERIDPAFRSPDSMSGHWALFREISARDTMRQCAARCDLTTACGKLSATLGTRIFTVEKGAAPPHVVRMLRSLF